MCNGPSLKTAIYQSNFEGLNLLVVNYFALTDMFFILKPNYYIILDPNLSRKSSNQLEQRTKLIEAIAGISWEMKLFVPHDVSNDWMEKSKIIDALQSLNIIRPRFLVLKLYHIVFIKILRYAITSKCS